MTIHLFNAGNLHLCWLVHLKILFDLVCPFRLTFKNEETYFFLHQTKLVLTRINLIRIFYLSKPRICDLREDTWRENPHSKVSKLDPFHWIDLIDQIIVQILVWFRSHSLSGRGHWPDIKLGMPKGGPLNDCTSPPILPSQNGRPSVIGPLVDSHALASDVGALE